MAGRVEERKGKRKEDMEKHRERKLISMQSLMREGKGKQIISGNRKKKGKERGWRDMLATW